MNIAGTTATAAVTAIVMISKFTEGAWIPTALIPLLVLLFTAIHRHYETVADELRVSPDAAPPQIRLSVIVLVGPTVNRGVLNATAFAQAMKPHQVRAVNVSFGVDAAQHLREDWQRHGIDIPLDILTSPYRELSHPLLRYIDRFDSLEEGDILTVVLPEFVVRRWWEQVLHNQSALWLKARLLFRPNTVVVSVPVSIARGRGGDDTKT